MDNEELINKCENVGFEYFKLSKEIFLKRMNKEICDKDWERFAEISMKGASMLIDSLPTEKLDKEIIQKGMIEGLNKCMDENR